MKNSKNDAAPPYASASSTAWASINSSGKPPAKRIKRGLFCCCTQMQSSKNKNATGEVENPYQPSPIPSINGNNAQNSDDQLQNNSSNRPSLKQLTRLSNSAHKPKAPSNMELPYSSSALNLIDCGGSGQIRLTLPSQFQGSPHKRGRTGMNEVDIGLSSCGGLGREKMQDSVIGRVSSGLHNASIHLEEIEGDGELLDYDYSIEGGQVNGASANFKRLTDGGGAHHAQLAPDEIDCNIDEDFDNEHYHQEKNINNSFINKLKDFSTFNPSGNKGREKINMSVIVVPQSLSRAGGANNYRFSILDNKESSVYHTNLLNNSSEGSLEGKPKILSIHHQILKSEEHAPMTFLFQKSGDLKGSRQNALAGSTMNKLNSMQPADIVMIPLDSMRKLDALIESPRITDRESPSPEIKHGGTLTTEQNNQFGLASVSNKISNSQVIAFNSAMKANQMLSQNSVSGGKNDLQFLVTVIPIDQKEEESTPRSYSRSPIGTVNIRVVGTSGQILAHDALTPKQRSKVQSMAVQMQQPSHSSGKQQTEAPIGKKKLQIQTSEVIHSQNMQTPRNNSIENTDQHILVQKELTQEKALEPIESHKEISNAVILAQVGEKEKKVSQTMVKEELEMIFESTSRDSIAQKKIQPSGFSSGIPLVGNASSTKPTMPSSSIQSQSKQQIMSNIEQQAKHTQSKSYSTKVLTTSTPSSNMIKPLMGISIPGTNPVIHIASDFDLTIAIQETQMEFFRHVLLDREEKLREQKAHLHHVRSKLRHVLHKHSKLEYLSRETQRDNLDLQRLLNHTFANAFKTQ